jgi:Ca2+-binding RTX toxin-like protein
VRSAGYNLIGSADGCEIDLLTLHSGPGDQHGSSQAPLDPRIDPSDHFNGGLFVRAFTHALLPTSRAVNNGGPSGSACPATDARGVPRGDGHCDIGAYELVRCGTRLVNRVGTAGRDSYVTPEMAPTAGSDGVLGFGGNDTLRGADGNDAVCGGAGDDSLSGGAGSDFLTGGSGRDQIAGNSGNDTIDVRDHERDVVGCGPGDDHVTADGIDQVASNCEHVTRLG